MVSERPNFAEVLDLHRVEHERRAYPAYECSCGWNGASGDNGGPDDGQHDSQAGADAHLAAVLNAEVDRWLADEGTRERVAEAGSEALVCKRTCPDDCDGSRCKTFRRLLASGVWLAAQPALAALATPTVPTAEEGEK